MNHIPKFFLFMIAAIPASFSCGDAITAAQDFSPNKPPVITSMTSVSDVPGLDTAALINHITFDISVEASDPENQNLTYTYSSDLGSFAGQIDTATGSTVKFVTGSLKAGDNVTVTLTLTDTKHGVTVKELPIGTGKAIPLTKVTAAAPAHLALNTAGSVSVQADCDGFFQIVEDDAATASTLHFDGANRAFTITDKNTSYPLTIQAYTAAGTHKVWILFSDFINQESAPILCTVAVP